MLAISVRTFLVMSRSFPLNDGALFFLMAQEIGDHGFRLPVATAYNAANIPFAYSPLGFYLAAFLHVAGGVDLLGLFRALPLVFSCLCVLAFYLLARDLAPTRSTRIASLVTFAVLPRSFLWLIMGGGLTRSMGFFFAILTLWQLLSRIQSSGVATRRLGDGVCLAHGAQSSRHRAVRRVQCGVDAAVVRANLAQPPGLARDRRRDHRAHVAVVGERRRDARVRPVHRRRRDGRNGFRHAPGRSAHEARVLRTWHGGTAVPLIGALAILGSFATLTRRGAFLPLWWLTIILLDTRAGATYASIPVALLAGLAITEVIVPIIARPPLWGSVASDIARGGGWETVVRAPRQRQWAVAVVLFVLIGYGIASSVVRRPSLGAEGRYLTSLTTDDRMAMSWVVRHTAPTSRFVIVVGGAAGGWWADRVGEWFPVLARRVSVATVQGTEWLPAGTFENREREYDSLQGCAVWGVTCLEQWARASGRPYTHVYIPKTLAFPCCGPLDSALRHDPTYRLLFDGPGAAIYELREPALW